jgi:hypothetical protein
MTDGDRGLFIDLRQALLRLHKTMLDWERAGYERIHGRTSGHPLLQAILTDPQFAWLRPISELIVRIDELLEGDDMDLAADGGPIVAEARRLVTPAEQEGPHARRYELALQEHPDAVLAHRDVASVLKKHRGDTISQTRPH